MGVLFLLNAAKKTDQAFRAAPRATAHTVRSFQTDVNTMVQYLQEKRATEETGSRNTPIFKDPTEQGLQKLSTTSWIQDRLSSVHQDEEGAAMERGEVDLDYELYSVT